MQKMLRLLYCKAVRDDNPAEAILYHKVTMVIITQCDA
ncbi:hypothetical protein EcWSU1_00906 [Enterobacter ludwigii]|uniref:Uncharacterized protein n=1 Tax=Enterobacter ludwigii TaxID=299767 RepID=G8LP86_9ENTR|nr:hypothetical protein EcWSU1_00906 [Enterobacter ludwigii]